MSTFRLTCVLRWSTRSLLFLLCAAAFFTAAHADNLAPNTNTNAISVIWRMVYGAQDIDPDADPDGDGLSNRQEAIAGTNPFDPRSAPRISVFTVTNKVAQ